MSSLPAFTDKQLSGLMSDMERFIVTDLGFMIQNKCNVPLALTLSVLTETLGGFARGTFRVGQGRANYERGLLEMGVEYAKVVHQVKDSKGKPLLYRIVRSALVHTYIFSKAVEGRIYLLRIQNDPEAGIERISEQGLGVTNHIVDFVTNTYAADLINAYGKRFALIRAGDSQARTAMEHAILSQR